MRICHYGMKQVLDRSGGVEVVVAELASRQAALGHDVTCYNRSGHHVSGSEHDMPKVKEWRGVHMKYVPTIPRKGLAAFTSSLFATLCCLFRRYDVIHIHAEGPAAFCGLLKLCGKRVVCTNHGLDWKRRKWTGSIGERFIRWGEKMSAKYADELIVLSPEIQGYFKETYHRETRLIPNGVNKPVRKEPELIREMYGLKERDYILFLSRVTVEKRVDLLIKAYKKLNTDKKLVVAGGASDSGTYLNEMKQLAGDGPEIIFTGFVRGQLLDELYSNAYVYVLPSDIEGMPLTLLEAMSYGSCCLVSDIAECRHIIGSNGIMFRQGDEESLREQLQKILDNEEDAKALWDKTSEYICEKYNWDRTVQETLKVYA